MPTRNIRYDAGTYGIDLIAGELLPTVSMNGSATRSYYFNGPQAYERVYLAQLSVSVPVYQQGQEYSRLRAQKHTAGQLRIDVDVARRDTVELVTKAWEALATARARIVSYSDQIKAAQIALEGVQRESQVGSRTVLDVLNAEQELLNARVNLVQAQHDETVAAFTAEEHPRPTDGAVFGAAGGNLRSCQSISKRCAINGSAQG